MLIHTIDDAACRGIEYHSASAFIPKIGMLLKIEGGLLVPAAGTDKPSYICLCDRESSITEGDEIPVHRLDGAFILEDHNGGDFSEIKVGTKLNIADDSIHLSTAAGGCAEVISISEPLEGGYIIRVRIS